MPCIEGAQRSNEAQQRIQQQAASITKHWPNAPKVVTIASFDEAPAAARRENQRQSEGGASGSPEAFWHDGRVYLVADALHSPQDVARAVAHEVLGHHGLRGHFGPELDKVLNAIANFKRKELAPYLERYGLDASKKSDRQVAAEEYLADMAANNPRLGLVQRAIAAVRSWLRRHVPALRGLQLSDAEIIRDFLEPARRFVESKTGRGEQPNLPQAVVRALERAQSVPMRKANNFKQAREAAKAFQGKPLTNEATGMVAVVSRTNLDKMLSGKAVAKSETPAIHSMAVANVDSLFARAVHGWSKPDRDDRPNIVAIHRFFAPMKVDDRVKMVKLTIKELADKTFNNTVYTLEAVEFNNGNEGRQWMEAAAREDGIELDKEIPQRGEWEVEIAKSGPKTSLGGFLPESSAAGDALILAQEIERRNLPSNTVFSRSQKILAAGRAAVEKADGWLDKSHAMPHDWTPQQQAAAAKFDSFSPKQPVSALLRSIQGRFKDRAVQLIFDQFRPLKSLSEEAFMQAHLSKATDGALEAVAVHGLPMLKDGALAVQKQVGGGFFGALGRLGDAREVNQFLMWVAGNRAERLMEEGRENLFTPEDIAALKLFDSGKTAAGKERKSLYAETHRRLQEYNRALLDIAEQAGLVHKEGRAQWESDFYLPFYRVQENGGLMDFSTGAVSLARQDVIKRLKGGTDKLGDPLANIMANWHMMLAASLRNMAANKALEQGRHLGIAERVASHTKNNLWTMQDGKKVHWQVDDPLVLDALNALNFTGYNNPAMKAAAKFKHALTVGVTTSPVFRIRNLMRDTLQTLAVADVSHNPIKNAVEGWKLTAKDSETMAQLLAGGGAVRFGSFNDGQQAESARRMIAQGFKDSQILDTPQKLKGFFAKAWRAYQENGDRAETINRAAVYQRTLEKTGSHLQASFAARDVMNFTSLGSSAAIRALAQVLPFFNARLQGLDKLARGAKDDPRRFAVVAGYIGMASALLYLLQADDEEYKALPDYVRDTYWPVKLGRTWAYIPKPFEIGALGTVVERFTELAIAGDDYQAKDFRDTLVNVLAENLSLNPVPQIIRPLGEVWFNHDMFRNQAIDSMADERLLPEERYTANTSAAAVLAGRALEVSPKRIEHLIKGYFGWLGVQALNVADKLVRPMMDVPASPRHDWSQVNNWMVAGDLFKQSGSTPDKYTERFYRVQRQLDAIYATASAARKSGELEKYRALMQRPELRARPVVQQAGRRMSEVNQRMRAVMADRTIPIPEKRRLLDALRRQRAHFAQMADEAVRAR